MAGARREWERNRPRRSSRGTHARTTRQLTASQELEQGQTLVGYASDLDATQRLETSFDRTLKSEIIAASQSMSRGASLPSVEAVTRPAPPKRGWSREIKVAVIQLVIVTVTFGAAAIWNASRDPFSLRGRDLPSARLPDANPGLDEDGSWLEGGAIRTLRTVTRRLDFTKGSKKGSANPAPKPTKSFKGKLDDFELPAPAPRWVKKATERVEGGVLHRDLRFQSGESVQRLTDTYVNHLETQGYRVNISHFGRIIGGGAEILGAKGEDTVTVKLQVGAEGKSTAVTVYERIKHLQRR